jgi:hypothetical protein
MGLWLERDMSPRAPDVPEQIQQFARKEKPPPEPKEAPPRSDGDVLDQAGQAIVGLLQHATRDRAMEQARKLSHQLHAAEGRIDQLHAEIEQAQGRTARAEKWLARIYQEIEAKLIHARQ